MQLPIEIVESQAAFKVMVVSMGELVLFLISK